ncbi:MAG TPA: ABC transporter permease [Candidatus Kapabacteria bacterium]|nr:ABC transporter permease [Candidatus Kapabacteria bacterium]
MQIGESISLAVKSVLSNKLRSFLTLLSISIGVFAIVGATTIVDSFNAVFSDQLSALGGNTFSIQKYPAFMLGPKQWMKYSKRKDITYQQAMMVRDRATLAMSVSTTIANSFLVKGNGEVTDAPVSIIGGDDNYCVNNNFNVALGRALTAEDVTYKRDVAVLGADVAKRLFDVANPVGASVQIGPKTYTVIGVLAPTGTTFGISQDNFTLIPITSFLKYYTNEWNSSVNITVRARSKELLDETTDQVIGILRTIRKVAPWNDNDFEVATSESLTATFEGLTQYISYFAVGVSAISLLAAGIGIMNIMFVSVKERTREIGIRKAIGATRTNILTQFIIESITLCQLGGLAGIVLGIIAGNVIAIYLKTTFVIPYLWMLIAAVICTVIGVGFGAYPAWRAASLDPIDALRYE